MELLCFLPCERVDGAGTIGAITIVNATGVVSASAFPIYTPLNIAIVIRLTPEEMGEALHLEMKLLDANGNVLTVSGGPLVVEMWTEQSQGIVRGQFQLDLKGQDPGRYNVELSIERRHLATHPLLLVPESRK